MNNLDRLREAYDNMLIAEIQRYGGIPALYPEEQKLREVIAELLLDYLNNSNEPTRN
jgi:hypothetical protein